MHQVACSLCAVHVSGRWIEEGHWLTSVMQMIWWDCVPLRNEMRRWRSVAPKCLRSWFSREITLYWCLHLSPYISPLVMFDDLRVHLFRPPYFFLRSFSFKEKSLAEFWLGDEQHLLHHSKGAQASRSGWKSYESTSHTCVYTQRVASFARPAIPGILFYSSTTPSFALPA